jgi:hypothetical protein
MRKNTDNEWLKPGETAVMECRASYLKGVWSFGGRIWLTDRRLVFRQRL